MAFWKPIQNFKERSIFAASRFQQIFKILYRLPEGLERVLKKGKSSEFNPRNYERVQSSPSAKVWSHKSIKDTLKLPKNLISGKKRKFFKNPKKFPGPKQKYFQTLTDKISTEQLTKLQKIKPFGHSKAPKKKSDRYFSELPICKIV